MASRDLDQVWQVRMGANAKSHMLCLEQKNPSSLQEGESGLAKQSWRFKVTGEANGVKKMTDIDTVSRGSWERDTG